MYLGCLCGKDLIDGVGAETFENVAREQSGHVRGNAISRVARKVCGGSEAEGNNLGKVVGAKGRVKTNNEGCNLHEPIASGEQSSHLVFVCRESGTITQ